jgi:hypothetical protein
MTDDKMLELLEAMSRGNAALRAQGIRQFDGDKASILSGSLAQRV